jgi:hypothetical protein
MFTVFFRPDLGATVHQVKHTPDSNELANKKGDKNICATFRMTVRFQKNEITEDLPGHGGLTTRAR